MEDGKVCIGICGVGQIGKWHIEGHRKMGAAEVVAIAGITKKEATARVSNAVSRISATRRTAPTDRPGSGRLGK